MKYCILNSSFLQYLATTLQINVLDFLPPFWLDIIRNKNWLSSQSPANLSWMMWHKLQRKSPQRLTYSQTWCLLFCGLPRKFTRMPNVSPETFKLQKMLRTKCLRIQSLEVFSTGCPLDSETDLIYSLLQPLTFLFCFHRNISYQIPDCLHHIGLTLGALTQHYLLKWDTIF